MHRTLGGRLGSRTHILGRPYDVRGIRRCVTVAAGSSGITAVAEEDLKLRDRLAATIGVSVVTDDAVPEGHKGLHGFLYGDGSAEAHEGKAKYDYRQNEDDGSCLVPVDEWLNQRDGEKPLGVYALADESGVVQYISYSRNVVLAVKAHLSRVGPQRCALVRCMVFANRAMATRSNLEQEVSNWIDACPAPPPGNGPDQQLWDGRVFDVALMSEPEVAEYEDKKLKMRKAMGENLHDDVANETVDAKTRRLRLLQAVEGDNWSAVIDTQTQATIDPAAAAALAASSDSLQPSTSARSSSAAPPAAPRDPSARRTTQTSPKAGMGTSANAGSSNGTGSSSATANSSSGGASSSNGNGSSSSATAAPPQIVSPFMRANVHRAVGDAVTAPIVMTVESVDAALESVRPYLIADGGNVEVVAVENGDVFLRLQGACGTCPSSTATMKMGIERSLRATFGETLREVIQIGAVDMRASVTGVDAHLEVLRPAIKNFGGSIEVLSVGDGVAKLRYAGPDFLGMGITAAIKDKFPDVREVQLVK